MVLDNSICNRSDLTIQSFETLIDETTSAIHLGWGSSFAIVPLPGTCARHKIWTTGGGLHSQCHIATGALWYQAARWRIHTDPGGSLQLVWLQNVRIEMPIVSQTVRLKLSWGIPSIPSLWCPKPWPPNCTLSAKLHSFFRRRSCQSEALVAIDTLAHGVLSDLLSATGNNMDITWPVFWIMGRSRPCKTSIRSWATIPTSPCYLEDHFRSPRNVGCLSSKLRLEQHYGWMSVRYLKDYLGSQPLPTQLLDCTNHVAHLTHLTENWIQLHVIKLQHTAY